jgi:peptide/nickel transport system substrate-binding protein
MLLVSCKQATPTAEVAVPTEKPAEPTATKVAIVASEATPTAVEVVVSQYKESPLLADKVAAGELPPVDERISDNPLVTAPLESVGKYGGTINTASWWNEAGNVLLYISEPPIKWKADLTGYEPALAEAYEWSDDGKTFTLHLRKGVMWSDGEPYTTEDWRFWWEDMALNEDVKFRSVPGWLRNTDGTPITMTFPDEYTVVWTASDRSLWIDPYYMAQGSWEFATPMMKPAHFLKQYHPKYTPTATFEELEAMDKWFLVPDYPCLFAWCLTALSEDGQRYTWSRNPYYWRVDTEGNQLPYIDGINVELISDEQTRILACTQGKFDTAFRICGGPNEIPLIEENAAAAGIHLLKGWMNGAGAWPGYMINQYYVEGGKNYENDTPEMAAQIRALLRNAKFRQALSMGFDRNRLIDVAWSGIGDPKAATISPQSWHFAGAKGQEVYQEWAAAYAQFDAVAANALLDEIGMVDADADGFRDLPDTGDPFTLLIEFTDWGGSLKVQSDAAAEVKVQWEENIKVKVEAKNVQGQADVDSRTNEGYGMLRGAHISEIDIWTYPDWIFPIVNRYMFPLEGRYFAKGGETCTDQPTGDSQYPCGVKPEDGSPAAILQDLYRKGQNTKTVEERHQVIWDAIQVIIEQGPFVIGVSGDQPMPIFVKDYMRNILDYGVVGPWAPATPGNTIPAQWWMDQ